MLHHLVLVLLIRHSTSECLNYLPKNYTKTPPGELKLNHESLSSTKALFICQAPETAVHVSHTIVALPRISESEQFYEVHLYYHRIWKDPRVQFSLRENQSSMAVPVLDHHCFWIPEMMFSGRYLLSGQPVNDEIVPQILRYMGNDEMVFAAKYTLKVACRMEMSMYPMGSHNCYLIAFTPLKSVHYITWNKRKLFPDVKMSSGVFSLKAVHRLTVPKCIYKNDDHPCLVLHFVFKRNFSISLITVYFPSIIIVMVSFVSFWIDNQNVPGRVTLVVTSLLALLTQMLSVRDSLPAVSLVTAMDIWFFICVFSVACALFEFAVVHRVSLATNVSKMAAPACDPLMLTKWRRRMRRLDDVCRFMFPIVFFGITAIYFGVCQSMTA
ncbi:Glycine receptor subunit alphaZ1 [Halotydeus destructor]|nr:Glycine receptor subunit alphaZ1 [Halotydeus destructor]